MRQALHFTLGALLALGPAGCGGLDNAPFRTGTVHGQLTESDPATALVSVMGAPEVRSGVAPDGTFTLERVPAGVAELFILASASKTLRVPLIVQGGQSVSVGSLIPREASFLSVRVRPPSHQPVNGAQVSVVGTPVEQLRADERGRLSVGPLPEGCYTLSTTLMGFPATSHDVCVSVGENKEVKVNLPPPSSGCVVTGCMDGFLCIPDGRCVECTVDSHCGAGLACRGFQCEGESSACAPCDEESQCKSGSSCQELPDGASACVAACSGSGDCEDGFTCEAGRCLPDPAYYAGCHAYRQMGAACDGDARCRSLGIVNGLCIGGTCTLRCASGGECPATFSCENAMGGRVCVFEP